jgi:glycosyltransferase involved in cell wall biosynthesis
MTKYKIIHLGKYYPPVPGGIESHVQTLARAQASLGFKTTVLCVNTLNDVGEYATSTSTIEEIDNRVKVIRLGRWASLLKLDVCPGFVGRLWHLLKQHEEVIIFHLHTPNPLMLVASVMLSCLSFISGKRDNHLVITHHSDIVNQRLRKYALRPLEFLVYRQAQIVLTSDSYFQGSKFLSFFKKPRVLALGIDLTYFINPPQNAICFSKELNTNYGQPLWLCVGRLVYYKALHNAIAALVKVPGKLIIIGVGVLETELRALADKLEVADRIFWMGSASKEQLIGAYHAATALWFPSNARSEGFGLVQVEAMACGCPVINANIPGSGVAWVCRNEIEGLTVPINDVEAFANAALRLINENGLRDRLSEAAKMRAYSEFDHMVMAKRSLEIYAEVAGD